MLHEDARQVVVRWQSLTETGPQKLSRLGFETIWLNRWRVQAVWAAKRMGVVYDCKIAFPSCLKCAFKTIRRSVQTVWLPAPPKEELALSSRLNLLPPILICSKILSLEEPVRCRLRQALLAVRCGPEEIVPPSK